VIPLGQALLNDVLAGVFLVWLVLTALGQLPCSWARAVRTADRWTLLPRWNFFAPNPGSDDFILACRYYVPDGVTDWRLLCCPSARSFMDAIWHPQKVETKALSDVVEALRETTSALLDSPRLVEFSWPYIVLSRCCSIHTPPAATRFQFAVLACREIAATPRRIVFMSPVRELDSVC
jgi:hypothetical protein